MQLLIEYRLSEFKNLLGDHSNLDPPDSMPNSVVKRISADGSVGLPHVRVGHRQALIIISPLFERAYLVQRTTRC